MKDKKKKKGVAVIISIGPKMKTKPTDASTPDMKKYGSMPMKKYGSMPMRKAFEILKQNYTISNLPPHIRARNLPDMSPQRFIDEGLHRVGAKNYTRDFMPGPSRYDDEGFPEYDGEDLGPPYGKPEFGDEDARQAEMNEAERAAIEAEGMPEMRKPSKAPRPGDPRFIDPSKPRPRYPKDVFANK